MRRKCFCMLIGVISILFLLDCLDIPLRTDINSKLIGDSNTFAGEIAQITKKDDEYYKLKIKIISCNDEKLKNTEDILLSYYGDIRNSWDLYGKIISFAATLERPKPCSNPHCFDYRKYLKSEGIWLIGTIKNYKIVQDNSSAYIKLQRYLLKEKYLFSESIPRETRGMTMGVLFGDTSYMDEDVYQQFRSNGTAHVLAVSGLHIGILYGIYKKIIKRKKNFLIAAVFILSLFLYGTLSMWSPSSSRAIFMILMSLSAKRLDLRYDMLTAMSVIALCLICINPYVIFGAGFQMSFLAISSIAFFGKIIPLWVPDWLSVPVAVNLGLTIYQIVQFNYISWVSIIANIPIVYLCGYFVPAALASLGVFLIIGEIGFMQIPLDGCARLILEINKLSTLDGKGASDVPSLPVWLAVFLMICLFFLSSELFYILRLRGKKKIIFNVFFIILIISATFGVLTYSPIDNSDVIFVDVGQGDCIHIRSGGKNILIDGGGKENYNVGEKVLKPYLLKNGVSKMDIALVSHEHTDHYKGIEELNETFRIDRIVRRSQAGEWIKISQDMMIKTLWPLEIDKEEGQSANSQCSVFMVHIKGYKILLTGDLDSEGERQLINHYSDTSVLNADILKIGHHGSGTSTSDDFLKVVNPRYAVIQVGKNNYGHPSEEVIEKITKKGIILLKNDFDGAIGFSFSDKRIICSRQNGE